MKELTRAQRERLLLAAESFEQSEGESGKRVIHWSHARWAQLARDIRTAIAEYND